jgi:hypothetical protein
MSGIKGAFVKPRKQAPPNTKHTGMTKDELESILIRWKHPTTAHQGEHQEGGGCMIQGLLSNAHLLDDL